MKKILFLLLCTVQIYGQTSTGQEQSFPYGIVNESLQTITTPTYIGTFGTDGTQGKIPSALIAKTSDVAYSLATKENVANKSDSYTTSSSTTYASTKAIVDGLATKQNTLTNPITGTGTNGHISFWNGANTQTGDTGLIWDNTNKRLGIGTTNPLQKFVVSDTGANGIEIAIDAVPSVGCIIQSYDRASFVYRPLEYSSSKHFFNNGNVLIATGTDNGVDKLQVNGTISASAATTANQVVIKSQLDAVVPYKKYVALISQTGTSAPTATVLENTLGGTVVWTRSATGIYVGTLSGAFTANKTFTLMNSGYNVNGFEGISRVDADSVKVQTYLNGPTYSDGRLSNSGASVEIRVYN